MIIIFSIGILSGIGLALIRAKSNLLGKNPVWQYVLGMLVGTMVGTYMIYSRTGMTPFIQEFVPTILACLGSYFVRYDLYFAG